MDNFTTKAFLQDMEYLREGDENTEISTGCQCQCQSLALDSTRYKTGRLTAQGDKDDTMITIVVDSNYSASESEPASDSGSRYGP